MATGYLRYPHVHGDLITFVAGDDVWLVAAAAAVRGGCRPTAPRSATRASPATGLR